MFSVSKEMFCNCESYLLAYFHRAYENNKSLINYFGCLVCLTKKKSLATVAWKISRNLLIAKSIIRTREVFESVFIMKI